MKLFFKRRAELGCCTEEFFFVEAKTLFSLVLVRVEGKDKIYHEHAYNVADWVLSGRVEESMHGVDLNRFVERSPSIFPAKRGWWQAHRVESKTVAWVLEVRGPWVTPTRVRHNFSLLRKNKFEAGLGAC